MSLVLPDNTVGLYSEQAIESMHAEVSQIMRAYAGMGNTFNKHKLVFRLFTVACTN